MGLGYSEIIVLFLVILIVFGPRKLPELSRAIGRGMREFRKAMRGLEDAWEGAASEEKPGDAAEGANHITKPDRTEPPA